MLMLVQLGGLGFMTSATWIALMFNRRISLRERMILQEAMGQYQIQGIVDLIRRVLVYTLIIEGAGALLLTLRFSAIMPLSDAAYFGIFQSISIFNNAGFDLFGQIHGPFSGFATYVADPFINIILMLLIFLGGVGFIVILILLNIRNARNCLFTQGCINRNVTINRNWGCHDLYSGAWQSQNIRPLSYPVKSWLPYSNRSLPFRWRQHLGYRESGAILPVLHDSPDVHRAPGSTGGGIKVTTFAVLIGAVVTMIQGKRDVVLYRNRISQALVYRSITLTILSLSLLVGASMFLSITESGEFLRILFEAVSAFGTAGLSMGLTTELSGKVTIALLMFLAG